MSERCEHGVKYPFHCWHCSGEAAREASTPAPDVRLTAANMAKAILYDVVGQYEDGTLLRGSHVRELFRMILAVPAPPAGETARERIAEELRNIAAWIRIPGNINADDAIDECARVLENRAAALRSDGRDA